VIGGLGPAEREKRRGKKEMGKRKKGSKKKR